MVGLHLEDVGVEVIECKPLLRGLEEHESVDGPAGANHMEHLQVGVGHDEGANGRIGHHFLHDQFESQLGG